MSTKPKNQPSPSPSYCKTFANKGIHLLFIALAVLGVMFLTYSLVNLLPIPVGFVWSISDLNVIYMIIGIALSSIALVLLIMQLAKC